jgi:hypothetical protein
MPTASAHLGLAKPLTSDPFLTSDLFTNLGILDQFPGVYICTSGTRPTWGVAQTGMAIYETDTTLSWRWSGTAWGRTAGKGPLGAPATITSNVVIAGSGGPTTVITNTVTVPAGGRTCRLTFNFPAITGTAGSISTLALYRSVTKLTDIGVISGTGCSFTFDDTGASAGSTQWSVQINNAGQTCAASSTRPITLSVVEL